jgi:hypothetical protein
MTLSSVKQLCVVLMAAGALTLPPPAPAAAGCGARPDGKYRVYVSPKALLRNAGVLLGTYDSLGDAMEAARKAPAVPVVIAGGTAADRHYLNERDQPLFYEVYTATHVGWMCQGSYTYRAEAAEAAARLLADGKAVEIVSQFGPR